MTAHDDEPGPAAEDPAQRRADLTELAGYHLEAKRIRSAQESARAQVLIDRFVEGATAAGLPAEELTARPWSGRGRYRTGIRGWYLLRDRSVGVGTDGGFYELLAPPVRFGRWRTVRVSPVAPLLQLGRGARDGESIALDAALEARLGWPVPGGG